MNKSFHGRSVAEPVRRRTGGGDIPRGWVANDLRMSDRRAEIASRTSFTRPADDLMVDHTCLTRYL